jgi:hypothetical protein
VSHTVNDTQFITILNAVSRDRGLHLPVLTAGQSPSGEFLAEWAQFLETCVRKGVGVSDPRWQRVAVESNAPCSRFTLEAAGETGSDEDFRVGLQLLLGMLDGKDDVSA